MGYRARLGKVAKIEKARFEGKSCAEVEAMMAPNEACYHPSFHTQLLGLGKYYELTRSKIPFYSFDIEAECESEFFIMSKEELKELIEDYHELIYKNYEKLAQGVDTDEYPVENFLRSRAREWCNPRLLPYYLDQPREECDGDIVSSWQYEYQIFNLVYIYRTFDWENNYLIFSAW